jgi:hypothetical protein
MSNDGKILMVADTWCRLFMIVNKRTNKHINVYYLDKQVAKKYRDELNSDKDNGWRVTYGPDHWRYKS